MSTILAFLAFWLLGWAWSNARAARRVVVPAQVAEPTPRPMPREPVTDFVIIKIGPANCTIRWRGGREEVVTGQRLATLKKSFLWIADVPLM